jgi:hypothetical protein
MTTNELLLPSHTDIIANLFDKIHKTFKSYKNTFLFLDNVTTCDLLFSKRSNTHSISLFTNIYIYPHFAHLMFATHVKHKASSIDCLLDGINITLYNTRPTKDGLLHSPQSDSALNVKHLHYDFVTGDYMDEITKQKIDADTYAIEFLPPRDALIASLPTRYAVKSHTVFELYELGLLYNGIKLPKIFVVPLDAPNGKIIRSVLKNLETHGLLTNVVIKHINENPLLKRILGIPLSVKIQTNLQTVTSIETFVLVIWLSITTKQNTDTKNNASSIDTHKKCNPIVDCFATAILDNDFVVGEDIEMESVEISVDDNEFADYSDKLRQSTESLKILKEICNKTNELAGGIINIELTAYELDMIKMSYFITRMTMATEFATQSFRYAYIMYKYGHVRNDDYFRELNVIEDVEYFLFIKNNEVLKEFGREVTELIPLFASSQMQITIYDLQQIMIYIYENMFETKTKEITITRCRELFHVILSGMKINRFMQAEFNGEYLLNRYGNSKLIEENKKCLKSKKDEYEYYKNRYAELKKYVEEMGIITV